METQKPLLKDKDGEEVDVHMYRSMIGSLMYLTTLRPNIMFAVCACARYQVNPKVSHLHAVKRIFRYLKGQQKLGLWYLKDSPFDLVAYTDSDYDRASLDMKYTTGGGPFFGLLLVILNTAEILLLVILNTVRDEESLGEDASKQGRIKAIDADEDITLVNDQDNADKDMFDVNDLGDSTTTTTITTEEITLAQALEALKSSKPKDKGKEIMIEEPVKPKKKDQIRLDEKATKRAFKRVNTFKDIITELVKGKEKRVGEELIQESTKKQKVEDDKEKAELKQLMKTIPDEEEVAIDAISLAVKSSRIVDWKIHKEGKKSYYQIVRADRKSQIVSHIVGLDLSKLAIILNRVKKIYSKGLTSEGLHKGYNRFQALLSHLEVHGAGVSHKDANQKFLRSLPSSGSQVALIMITKSGLDTLSFDDLYNNLRVFERNVKGTTTSSSTYRFAPQVDYDDLEKINDDDMEEMDLKWQVAMISIRIKKFYKRTGRKLQFDTKDPVGFDKIKVKCFNCHKTDHFARDDRAKGNQDSRRRDDGYNGNKTRDNGRKPAYHDDSKALVTIDGEDIDWSRHVEEDTQNYAMMAYSSSNSGNYMPSGPDVEIYYSKFTYGPKQTSSDESDSKPSEYASCESNSSVETSTSMYAPIENASKVVCEPRV
nr:uncharacterized mitochondrial protein AtMg00810-like [Tanacetum cinerariifolium]